MGCQKWLCLSASNFLVYLWRSRLSEIVQRTVQLTAFLALADLFWHSNISNVKNAECHYRLSVHFGMCARKCMNNHGKQYVYFLYLFLSIHLRRYFVSFDDRLIFENVWVVFNYNEKDFVSVRSVGEIESPLSSTFYLSLKMSFMISKCTVVWFAQE